MTKQKQFLHNTHTDYGFKNEKCKFLKTRACIKGVWKDLYPTILDAWTATKDYPQCSAGLQHNRRDVIVIDLDYETETETKPELPIPYSYSLYNEASKHWQFGLFLTAPVWARQDYIKLVHALNKLCGGDKRYTGWQCKNPLHFKGTITNKKFKFAELYRTYCGSSPIMEAPPSSSPVISENEHFKISSKELIDNDSRHGYFLEEGRRFVWSHKGCTEADLLDFFLDLNQQFPELVNKEPESFEEVKRQAESIYKWAIDHYKEGKKPVKETVIEDTTRWHELGLQKRQMIKDYKIEKLQELIDTGTTGSIRYMRKKMKELFDIKVSIGWISQEIKKLPPSSSPCHK
ncbi:hypothetical protein FACS1894140_6220 [Spirochaetia bacterium]|nr:hypothetical protein FACS1894140_6220 [Spirochaetia bacterium]